MAAANLTNADLNTADLTNTDLTGANLTGVRSGSIVGTPSSLPAGWQLINGYLVGSGANLTGANLYGADLTNADLTGANLYRNLGSGAIIGTPLSDTSHAHVSGWQVNLH